MPTIAPASPASDGAPVAAAAPVEVNWTVADDVDDVLVVAGVRVDIDVTVETPGYRGVTKAVVVRTRKLTVLLLELAESKLDEVTAPPKVVPTPPTPVVVRSTPAR